MNKKIEPWREELRQIAAQRIQGEQLDDSLLDKVTGGTRFTRLHDEHKCTNPAISESVFASTIRVFDTCGSFKGHEMFGSHRYFCVYCDYFELR